MKITIEHKGYTIEENIPEIELNLGTIEFILMRTRYGLEELLIEISKGMSVTDESQIFTRSTEGEYNADN